jgi:type IV pilus assembly protein PilA
MKGLRKRNAGFTLIELMIVVAIIGVLVAIAVPSFLRYQLRAKRSEAYANLEAIATAETSYFAANGLFWNTGASVPGPVPISSKRPWTLAADTAFSPIGFRPEGNVYFDYDVNTACSCAGCFTATAYGDVDGDSSVSALMYVHQDALGAVCGDGLGLGFGTPIENGAPVYDQVSWNTATADDF